MAWDGDASFVVEAGDDRTCAADWFGAEVDWLVGVDVGNAVMVDDTEKFCFMNAVNGLRLFVMVNQIDTFCGSQTCSSMLWESFDGDIVNQRLHVLQSTLGGWVIERRNV
jgi:hypothetical protein